MALFHPLGKRLGEEFSLCWAWMRLAAAVYHVSQPVGSVPAQRDSSRDSSSAC